MSADTKKQAILGVAVVLVVLGAFIYSRMTTKPETIHAEQGTYYTGPRRNSQGQWVDANNNVVPPPPEAALVVPKQQSRPGMTGSAAKR